MLSTKIASRDGGNNMQRLAVTIATACELTGFGATSIWAFLKDGRLKAVRVPGVRRTLVTYDSLARLLAPAPEPQAAPRRRSRPRKNHDPAVAPRALSAE